MSTISKPVMVHQESNFIYRPAVKSEVLVSLSGLQRSRPGCLPGVLLGDSEVGHKLLQVMSSNPSPAKR